MAVTLPDVGEVKALDDWLATTTPEAQTLKLYTNNVTPAEGDTASTYTEAAGSGYAAKSLARATWNAASTAAGVTTKSYPAQAFNFTGAITIYGYFIVDAGGNLLGGGNFDGSPLPMNSALDVILTTLTLRLSPDGYVSVVS